jgi:homoserine kinase
VLKKVLPGSLKKPRPPQSLNLVLPATSANLGPALDAAALAFSMFLKIRASTAPKFSIAAEGRDADICRRMQDQLILTTYREVLESQGKAIQPLVLNITNEIPIGKGCGSSAAARLAGIALAVHFGRLRWNDSQIVSEAARREHHPDNAAACWMGGLAVARTQANGEAKIATIRPKGKWPLLLAVPLEALPTEQARSVLPEQYSRDDAVINIQNSMLLLGAFTQGRPDLLSVALQDRLHEPYRAHLCPLLPALQRLGDRRILGVALSGAGPSVLIFLDSDASAKSVSRRVREHLRLNGLQAELLPVAITLKGGRRWLNR